MTCTMLVLKLDNTLSNTSKIAEQSLYDVGRLGLVWNIAWCELECFCSGLHKSG